MNRKLLFVCTLLLSSSYLHAQIGKGSLMIGGQLRYGSFNSRSSAAPEVSETDQFVFSLSIGKAIRENLFIGIDLNTAFADVEQSNFGTQQNTSYGGGLFKSEERRVGKECRSRWSWYL